MSGMAYVPQSLTGMIIGLTETPVAASFAVIFGKFAILGGLLSINKNGVNPPSQRRDVFLFLSLYVPAPFTVFILGPKVKQKDTLCTFVVIYLLMFLTK